MTANHIHSPNYANGYVHDTVPICRPDAVNEDYVEKSRNEEIHILTFIFHRIGSFVFECVYACACGVVCWLCRCAYVRLRVWLYMKYVINQRTVKVNSHVPCCAHAVPITRSCRAALIHTCPAAPLPFSHSAVSFAKVRVVAGNIRTASPTV
jgi:hypothetical protein